MPIVLTLEETVRGQSRWLCQQLGWEEGALSANVTREELLKFFALLGACLNVECCGGLYLERVKVNDLPPLRDLIRSVPMESQSFRGGSQE